MIGSETIAKFLLTLAIGALLSVIVMQTTTPSGVAGSSAELTNFANSVANPSEVTIDTPTGRFSDNPISAVYSYAVTAGGWLGFLARAASLDFPFFVGWAQPFRYLALLGLYLPLMYVVGYDLLKASLGMIGGAFSRLGALFGL